MSEQDSYGARRRALIQRLGDLPSLAVAFSGGVDSSVLAHAAREALGEHAVAVIADSASLPRRELVAARRTAADMGIRLVELTTDEQSDPDYQANRGDRCYFCKAALFRALDQWRQEHGIASVALGEIADDALDVRPGRRAAQERGVLAPLAEVGFSKQDVRRYATEAGMSVADKPASACLASRIPVGTRVSGTVLAQVEAAEDALHDLGLNVVRVRHHGTHAQVELGAADLERAECNKEAFSVCLRGAGFMTHEVGAYLSPFERATQPSVPEAASTDLP